MVAIFDLRSDTVTKPTALMRAAMASAEVGDDCYGDDPSVLRLEAEVRELLGKDAAVFLPSGTMANQLAVATHCEPGQTAATHTTAHVRIHEDASAAALSGVQIMPLGGRTGFTTADLEGLLAEEDCGWPRVGVVWLENTLGDAGGVVWPLDRDDSERSSLQSISELAHARGRPVHLDGARLWNAHVATGQSLAALAAVADTVSVAMSKGLGAPAGSVLCGTEALVHRARSRKHAFGGGLRQAGILAAAGSFGLEHHLGGLADDHRRARLLASAIASSAAVEVATPQTNMVIAKVRAPLRGAEELCGPLREAGVLCYPNRAAEVRLVVHLGINDEALDEIAERFMKVAASVVATRS